MNRLIKTMLYVVCLMLTFQGCSDDDSPVSSTSTTTTISTPTTYDFSSRFVDGESSVSYTGQVVRNVVIKDLKSLAGTSGSAESALLDLYNNGGGSTASLINTAKQTSWSDFGNTSKLSNKIASDILLGYEKTPDAQMKEWFSEVPSLISFTDGSYTRMIRSADSLELNRMIGKGLLGVVAYYQGTSVYMPRIDTANNIIQDPGDPYSRMEHYWDESFGYFGAARDYNTYANDDARKSSYDTNGDGLIDYKTEYNFAWATYAAKRDDDCAETCTSDNDFTGTIMGAYLEGRTLIHNQGSIPDITAQRTIIVNAWEKMVVANIIHYANSVSSKITAGNVSIIHAWAEMRAFAMALQYNQYKLISTADLTSIISDMGNTPPAAANWDSYKTTLSNIVSKLQTAYGFDDANIAAW